MRLAVPQRAVLQSAVLQLCVPQRFVKLGAVTRGIAVAALLLACSPAQEDPSSGPAVSEEDGQLTLYTVNYPLKYLAERVGGEIVSAVFPAPPDVDPAHWSPSPSRPRRTRGPT